MTPQNDKEIGLERINLVYRSNMDGTLGSILDAIEKGKTKFKTLPDEGMVTICTRLIKDMLPILGWLDN
jgi:hypothetical protein